MVYGRQKKNKSLKITILSMIDDGEKDLRKYESWSENVESTRLNGKEQH